METTLLLRMMMRKISFPFIFARPKRGHSFMRGA
jgi:hypothetical protein